MAKLKFSIEVQGIKEYQKRLKAAAKKVNELDEAIEAIKEVELTIKSNNAT